MNNDITRGEQAFQEAARKVDVILWIFSVPLIPMLAAEFAGAVSAETQIYFNAYYFTLWFVFVVDFFLRLAATRDKLGYLKTNWFDVLVVLTPIFRVFKAFHFMRLPVLLLSDRVLYFLGTAGLNFIYYFIFVGIVTFVGADLVLYFELGHENASILTFSDAVWWSILNLTTTGSGPDLSPVTFGGRVVGVVLMTLGFAIFSVLIASLISFFMKEYARRTPDDRENLLEGVRGQIGIEDVLARLERIERKMDNKG